MATLFESTATEWIVRERAPSGAQIHQLTSAPAINDHEYFEVPYMDASSRYVMFTRMHDSIGPVGLWRADLERRLVTKVAETTGRMRGHAVSPDQRFFYYTDLRDGRSYELVELDITTLERRAWAFDDDRFLPRTRGSVTPDRRYYINSAYLGNKRFGIWRLDMESGERQLLWEQGEDMCNAHPQLEPGRGQDLLIQHNRGAIIDDTGRHILLVGEIGATLYLIDINGQNHRTLPVGQPFTQRCQGHQCWLGTTGEILLTVGGPREEVLRAGNLLAVRPGDAQARVVAKGVYFDHCNASRDGRYFVSDTSPNASLVIGSIKTGRWQVLCETGSSLSSPQYTHPHPYLSPDNQWVIFNSDRTGIPHVYAARLPEGLLAGLEA